MEPEVLAAIVVGGITLIGIAITAWQAIRELKVRARIQVATKLVELRHEPYCKLWDITAGGPRRTSTLATEHERQQLANQLTEWYWPNGMLLSGEAQAHWRYVRNMLRAEKGEPDEARLKVLRAEISLLRSWLKADLFIREASQVHRYTARQIRQAAAQHSQADDV